MGFLDLMVIGGSLLLSGFFEIEAHYFVNGFLIRDGALRKSGFLKDPGSLFEHGFLL